MKKFVIWLLLASCMLSCLVLHSCTNLSAPPENIPYDLEFISNGDGTCYVSEVMVHADCTTPFTLQIPETSPEGETVVAVKLMGKFSTLQVAGLPRIVLKDDWKEFIEQFKNDAETESQEETTEGKKDKDTEKKKKLQEIIRGMYKKRELDKEDEEERQKYLEKYPLLQHTEYYYLKQWPALDLISESVELNTAQMRMEYDKKVLEYVQQHLTGEELAKVKNEIYYHNCTLMTGLSLPSTVKEVEIPEVEFKTVTYAGTVQQWNEVRASLLASVGIEVTCQDGQANVLGKLWNTKPEPEPQPEPEEIYTLSYLSNEDGTCTVRGITTRTDINSNFTLEIPERSPDGDYVISVRLDLASDPENLPPVLLVSDFEDILYRMKKAGISDFDFMKFTAYYLYLSCEGLSDQGKQELFDAFPLAEYSPFYVFDRNASSGDKNRISAYLTQCAGYSEEECTQDMAKVDSVYEWETSSNQALSFMTELVLPASVQMVDITGAQFKQISYQGTCEQWNKISKYLANSAGAQVECSDGTLTLEIIE